MSTERTERRRLTDEEVRLFIRERRTAEPRARHTRLLKLLRESGYACEQSRFRALFLEETRRHA
jgi:hypothetical protein